MYTYISIGKLPSILIHVASYTSLPVTVNATTSIFPQELPSLPFTSKGLFVHLVMLLFATTPASNGIKKELMKKITKRYMLMHICMSYVAKKSREPKIADSAHCKLAA